MDWLFKPKVQLGLFVNLVFVLFTCATHTPGRHQYTYIDVETGALKPMPPSVPHAPLPPPAAPSKSTVVDLGGGRANVLLTKDLTLVKKPGRTLVFSPSFNVSTLHAEPPEAVTLSFIIFSDKEEACPGACMLVFNADGTRVWESAANGTSSAGWTRVKNPATSTTMPDGQVAVTLAAETLTTRIPYTTFLGIIGADRVVLSLGPDKVELTHDQIDALRDMHRRVAPPVEEQHEPRIVKTFSAPPR
jgi:hypothetical protein